VKALRLEQINTLESANTYLEEEFLDELNERFHVTARSAANLHRSLPLDVTLDHMLCYQKQRVVQNDWTVSRCNRILQLSVAHQNECGTSEVVTRPPEDPGQRAVGWNASADIEGPPAVQDRSLHPPFQDKDQTPAPRDERAFPQTRSHPSLAAVLPLREIAVPECGAIPLRFADAHLRGTAPHSGTRM